MSETFLLQGDVRAVFRYGKEEDLRDAVEHARVEQELICGYALMVKHLRHTHFQDERGRDIYEVYATFAPFVEKQNGQTSGL